MEWSELLNPDRRKSPSDKVGIPDAREEFERDYGRIIFSPPVRRLKDKTQVFPLDPNDAVRTRLTHSLEVASVARGIAQSVSRKLTENGKIAAGDDRKIEAIASACGVIHDLGNPPFGHSGEDSIRHWFKKRFSQDKLSCLLGGDENLVNDFLNFEGNAQSLRIVARLQVLADHNGLNLTYGTLSAACKYLASSTEATNKSISDHAYKKPGYFTSERDLVLDIRDKTGTGSARNPITFLVEAADDAVYTTCDIEDAVKKGILDFKNVWDSLSQLDEELSEKLKKRTLRIIDKSDYDDNVDGEYWASAFRTAAIGVYVDDASVTFMNNYDAIMNGNFKNELIEASPSRALQGLLKDIAKAKVYTTAATLKLEIMGREVICDLMDVFWECAQELEPDTELNTKDFKGKIGLLFSKNYIEVFRKSCKEYADLPIDYHRLQLVTDYVCGMTDSYAKRLRAELRNV